MTVFLSTHTLSVAEEMADRIRVHHQSPASSIALGTVEELSKADRRERCAGKRSSSPSYVDAEEQVREAHAEQVAGNKAATTHLPLL